MRSLGLVLLSWMFAFQLSSAVSYWLELGSMVAVWLGFVYPLEGSVTMEYLMYHGTDQLMVFCGEYLLHGLLRVAAMIGLGVGLVGVAIHQRLLAGAGALLAAGTHLVSGIVALVSSRLFAQEAVGHGLGRWEPLLGELAWTLGHYGFVIDGLLILGGLGLGLVLTWVAWVAASRAPEA